LFCEIKLYIVAILSIVLHGSVCTHVRWSG